ncbi:MAG TPA: alcohol dehydrogenase catalytic domain-containing protein [bacterium]|nr:alcohol dehydrogenase catalytic domain-containing protein [bacterium]
MEKMDALVFKDLGKIVHERIPIPQVTEPNHVLVKVAACGICGTDVKILQGKHDYKKDTVLGHEFCGTVVEVGEKVTAVKKGDWIGLDNNSRCGLCEYCRMGMSSQCQNLSTLGIFKNGGFAEYALATQDVCYKLPDTIDEVTGTQTETLGTVLNGMNIVQMQSYDSVLVLGCGPIGYLFTALAKNVAASVAVTEIDPYRIEVAKKFDVPVFNPYKCNLEEEVVKLTNGKKFDIVIDAIGTQLENALDYVTAGGKILAFGMDDSVKATISPYQITRRAIKILGSYIGQNTILPSIKLLDANKLELDNFFTETIPLKEGPDAFKKLGFDLETKQEVPKQAMKIVLKP